MRRSHSLGVVTVLKARIKLNTSQDYSLKMTNIISDNLSVIIHDNYGKEAFSIFHTSMIHFQTLYQSIRKFVCLISNVDN